MRLARYSIFFLLLLFFATTVTAHADTVTMTLVGVGGAHQNGVYVAPYLFTFTPNGPKIGLMCDDFTHEDTIPETYTALVSTVTNLSQTRFFATYGLTGYEEVFWLFDQYLLHPSQAGNINFAVWAIFYPSLYTNPTLAAKYWTPAEQSWLDAANHADLSHYDFSSFRVYTPISPTTPQEMIGKVPEPAGMMLFGSGLIAVGGLVRRRIKN